MQIILCLILGIATMVATAPLRAQRENVLSFIEPTKNPSSGPEKEQKSTDVSEAKSRESFGTNEPTNTFKDPDSHEFMNPSPMKKGLSQKRTGSLNRDSSGLTGVSGGPVQELCSREHPGPVGAQQASREQINLHSQEGLTVGAQDVVISSGDQFTANQGTNFKRKAGLRRAPGSNGMLTQGPSTEVQDLDSLEENNGRPAATGNRGHTDMDETREMISSEIYPAASPGHSLSGSPAPAKSRLA